MGIRHKIGVALALVGLGGGCAEDGPVIHPLPPQSALGLGSTALGSSSGPQGASGSSSTGALPSTGGASSTSAPGASSIGSTGSSSSSAPPPTPELVCAQQVCVTAPQQLPPGIELRHRGWDPCPGQPYALRGEISLFESKQADQDHLVIGDYVFTGQRPIQLDLEGPVDLSLVTGPQGEKPSLGLVNVLRAVCGSAGSSGLRCQGDTCRTLASPLPGNFFASVAWDPCEGGPFRYEGEVDLEAGSTDDRLSIAGQSYSGAGQQIQGEAYGPVQVQLQTDRFGDSRGLTLRARCLPKPVGPQTMSEWNRSQVNTFVDTVTAFLDLQGRAFMMRHMNWHMNNDIGGGSGADGPGSGIAFMGLHRVMMNRFYRFVAESPGSRLAPLPIVTDEELPEGLGLELHSRIAQNLRNVGLGHVLNMPRFEAIRIFDSYRDSEVGIPRWFTLNADGPTYHWGNSYWIDGREYWRLADFRDPDEIGRACGVSGWHNAGHTRIGGIMGSHWSPADPIFWGWHRLIDDVITTWVERTPNGRAWASANPNHRILDRNDVSMEGWTRQAMRDAGGIAAMQGP